MQQKQEKKANKSADAKGSLAKMMAVLDKEKTAEGQTQLYIDLLKAPRGERYFYWLKETKRLCREIEELETEILHMEEEILQGEEEKTVEIEVNWLEEEEVNEPELSWLKDVEAVEKNGAVELQTKKDRLQNLKRQCQEKVQQLKKAEQEFLAQLPMPERWIGLIYPGWNTEILMKYGMIACPGNSYHTTSELLNQVKPKSEQEKEQWIKGDRAYKNYFWIHHGLQYIPDENFLLVEIYINQVCVVYKDGTVIVV